MSDARDKSPWYGTAEDGLHWILRDETCKTEQIELVAEKALEKIEALLALLADKGREIESLQRENEELETKVATRDGLLERADQRIGILQRENEELKADLKSANTEASEYERFAKQAEARVEELLSRPAITPEMRKKIERTLEAMGAMAVQVRALTPLEQTSRRYFRELLGEQG